MRSSLSAAASLMLLLLPALGAAFTGPRLGVGMSGSGGLTRSLTGAEVRGRSPPALRMSASPAVEQKGLVTVYHKESCPYCKEVVALLQGHYELRVTMVDVLGEESEKKIKQMKTFSGGRNTVPQVFFNSEHLGGNDDVQQLHSEGTLASLVERVRQEEPSMMKGSWFHPWY
jgi:glutaredoxin 3